MIQLEGFTDVAHNFIFYRSDSENRIPNFKHYFFSIEIPFQKETPYEGKIQLSEMPSVDGTNGVQDPPVPGQSIIKSPISTSTQDIKTSSLSLTPPSSVGEEKLSNAEIKKRAKAEKQAKRAQKKVELGVEPKEHLQEKVPRPIQSQKQKQSQAPVKKEPSQADSNSTPLQVKALPHRSLNHVGETLAIAPVRNDKHVGLFAHLYSHPKRTTIGGSAKDVHPAVLALGLQMREYVICGSSARCVATLLAFRRVCFWGIIFAVASELTG